MTLIFLKYVITALSLTSLSVEKPKIFAQIPLQWEITRNEFSGDGTASLTETYRETWKFKFLPGSIVRIESPRAEVQAHGVGFSQDPSHEYLPHYIIIKESDLKELIGLTMPNPTYEEEIKESIISIPLRSPSTALENFMIRLPDGESIKITLNFNQ